MDLLIIAPIYKDSFLSNEKNRLYIDNKKSSVNELMSSLPSAK